MLFVMNAVRTLQRLVLLISLSAAPSVALAQATGSLSALSGGGGGASAVDAALQSGAVPAELINAARQAQAQGKASPSPEGAQTDGTSETANAQADGAKRVSRTPNQFQLFVRSLTGQQLPVFGANLFEGGGRFGAVESRPINDAYLLNPGDEVLVRVYSAAADFDDRFVINRDGLVVLPKLGPIRLAGLQASQVEGHLKKAFSAVLADFNLFVSVGRLRGIDVYLVGHAARPGKHTVSGTSSLLNALFETGGPSDRGSYRSIELIRNGRRVGTLDLYDFLQSGNARSDLVLQQGDVIHIKSVGAQVALLGATDQAAIYELRAAPNVTNLQDIIDLSGGLPPNAALSQLLLERTSPEKAQPLSMESIGLDSASLKTPLRDGDMVTLLPIKLASQNAISIRLLGEAPIRIPLLPNGRVSDVIPSIDFLLTGSFYQRRINPGGPGFDRIISSVREDEVNWERALIERVNRETLQPEIIGFNLRAALIEKNPLENRKLQPGDVITILQRKDLPGPQSASTRLVRLKGEVNRPGVYQLSPGESLNQLIERAGGFTPEAYVFGTILTRDSIRRMQTQNLKQVVRQLEAQLNSASQEAVKNSLGGTDTGALQLINQQNLARGRAQIDRLKTLEPSGRLALELDPRANKVPNIALEANDEITIPSRPSSVQVAGAVINENALLHTDDRTVEDVIRQAGLLPTADVENAFVLRADGSALLPDMKQTSGFWATETLGDWFGGKKVQRIALMPGDTVIVPEKLSAETGYSLFMRGLKDWTQVVSQLGLGAVAIQTLRQ